jgi:hypothetical protein
MLHSRLFLYAILGSAVAGLTCSPVLFAQAKKPDLPSFDDISEGYEEVTSTVDEKPSMYKIWIRKKDDQMLAELPKSFATDRYFIALTLASGDRYAGLHAGERYVYWRKYNDRLALIEPNIATRSTGDAESKSSVKRLFTDRVILDVPIVALASNKAPVIDMDALLVGQASKFFPRARGINARLASIKTAKAFPENVELAFEVPLANGQLQTLHYSISRIPKTSGYKTRIADQRIGYFTTSFSDLGKYTDDETRVRYINRWHLEKADSNLKLSPPKNPIVFYIEHTTPKRYRYWVKQGILYWNKAFERVGLRDAIVVYQQDADSTVQPNHMEKDPEDVRWNFIRWLNNDIGTAIGPSRVNPLTGQILDADIILTDGWIRHYERQFSEILPKLAMEGFSPQTVAWLNAHPRWDPRILLAPPSERPRMLSQRSQLLLRPHGGHPAATVDHSAIGDDEYDGLVGRTSQINGMCLAADGKALDLAILRTTLALMRAHGPAIKAEEDDKDESSVASGPGAADRTSSEDDAEDDDSGDEEEDEDDDDEEEDAKEDSQMLDGVPEDFIGPLVAELVAHEVGHTLGLRHNFKGSSIYTLEEITQGETREKPHSGSVMDYLPINMNMKDGEFLGEHTMIGIGPYDMWAIEYGYSFDKNLKPILERVAEPELLYGSDEDTWGPDPRARRYDFSKNPIDYAKTQVKLARYHRQRLLDDFVEDGESWAKAREGYEMTLALQTRSLSMMANWIGGTFLSRDKKGDKEAREPMEVVPVERQREALQWVIENAFYDDAFDLTPELIRHLTVDQWLDDPTFLLRDVDYPVHDRIMGIQGSTLTMLMNPDTLRLVYDNELRTPAEDDIITLPELLDSVSSAVWREVYTKPTDKASERKPWISSLRRNLQREHLERLIDLTLPDAGFTAAYKPISNLALLRLRHLQDKIEELQDNENLDAYSRAHLQEAGIRIRRALDAQYIYNVNDLGGRSAPIMLILGQEGEMEVPGSSR